MEGPSQFGTLSLMAVQERASGGKRPFPYLPRHWSPAALMWLSEANMGAGYVGLSGEREQRRELEEVRCFSKSRRKEARVLRTNKR